MIIMCIITRVLASYHVSVAIEMGIFKTKEGNLELAATILSIMATLIDCAWN